jgi:hypothetical protein
MKARSLYLWPLEVQHNLHSPRHKVRLEKCMFCLPLLQLLNPDDFAAEIRPRMSLRGDEIKYFAVVNETYRRLGNNSREESTLL